MLFNFFTWIAEHPLRADESVMGAINRPLQCHPSLRSESVAMGREMLRCAQHDKAVTHTDGWIIVLICIIVLKRSNIHGN